MQKSAATKKIARLEAEIDSKQGIIDKWNSEWHDTQAEIVDLRTKLKAAEHEIKNRAEMAVQMGSRIGVLQSDRDRLTTVVEVLARRLMSPIAEMDQSRAGWRSFTNAISPRDEASKS